MRNETQSLEFIKMLNEGTNLVFRDSSEGNDETDSATAGYKGLTLKVMLPYFSTDEEGTIDYEYPNFVVHVQSEFDEDVDFYLEYNSEEQIQTITETIITINQYTGYDSFLTAERLKNA